MENYSLREKEEQGVSQDTATGEAMAKEQNNPNSIIQPAHDNATSSGIKAHTAIILAVVIIAIVIAIVAVVRPSFSNLSANTTPTTIISTSIVPNLTVSTIVKPFKEPKQYAVVNSFTSVYNFSSPLKYLYKATFKPLSYSSNCTSFEGMVAYFQNATMATKPYNISSLNKSEPIAEYASVIGITSANLSAYDSQFYKYGGFCNPSFAATVHNSTFSKYTYNFVNATVYLLTISNMSASAIQIFGSYLGQKPNATIYIGTAMYNGYRIKVVVAGFTGYVNALGLRGFTMNLTNRTISEFSAYLADHANASP